ncbi:beta-lactamase [Ruminococcus flavefaciens 007c]|uniref:Ribonuclease J n=2 Tax=Ruminococcus flavefaciens TaxID=1265 RepID=W7UYW3_RUMFL|nr:ribonuclease J [Ruminococcus flavefaciens]EWM53890.1 beta-lactamase [Ruminococcus flavefaciens 007c]
MNEKEKSSKAKQNASAAPKRTYRKRTPAKDKTANTAAAEKNTPAKPRTRTKQPKEVKKTPVRIIPLGGLNEIGKNMTVFECSNDMFILDCGLAFPDADMPGVDIVIPDFTYVERNQDKIRGIVITHGHEDHIGGLSYLLKKINVPVYATRLTIGLIEGKLKEQGLSGKVNLNIVEPKKTVKMGCMAVEFIKVNHSIPDSVGMAIHTPAGVIVHTGDFKVDYTPIDEKSIDLARFGELGSRGVLALMADSTNAERPGYTHSEKTVGDSFDKLFQKGEGKRIIIATFSSNIHRVQQIINCAVRYGRKVAVFGRSMVNVINTAIELGYLDVPDGIIIDIEMMNRFESEKIVLITTGSQGEPMSALTRMAMNDHKKVNITPMDFIIISATPIPGNEKFVTRVVNELMKSGAEVVYEAMYEVHVSGHACQEELKLMQALTRPKFFIPVHGEYKHLKKHADLARQMGMSNDNIIIAEIGNVIETDGTTMKVVSQVPAGRVLVDGLGVGDVGSIVLRDRKHLAQDGLIIIVIGIEKSTNEIVAGPDIISRGFVYVRESEELMVEARALLTDTLANCSSSELREWNSLKGKMRDALSDYIYQKTKRSPMILPIIMET